MKQMLERILSKQDGADKFHTLSTVFMILLFITFWGASFYVLINSFA